MRRDSHRVSFIRRHPRSDFDPPRLLASWSWKHLPETLWKFGLMLWPRGTYGSLSFSHDIKFVSSQVRQRFLFAVRPENLNPIEMVMVAEAKVYAQVMLR